MMKRLCFWLLALVCCCGLGSASAGAGEIKLVLFPFGVNAAEDLSNVQSGIASMLPGRLSMPGQIVVIEPPGLKAERVPADAEQLAVAKRLGADYLLGGIITKIGSTISIDARLVPTDAGDEAVPIFVQCAGMDALIGQLNVLAQKARSAVLESAEPQAGFAQQGGGGFVPLEGGQNAPRSSSYNVAGQEPEDWSARPPRRPQSPPSRFEADKPRRAYGAGPGALFEAGAFFSSELKGKRLHSICAGDVNGDGKKELIAAGPDIVSIYQVSGNSLAKIADIPVGIDEHVVHVDTGDFNGNGIDEVYVSCYETQSAISFVVEFRQNRYERLAQRQRWFYRAYPLSDASIKLIGQEAGTMSPFNGAIYLMEWKEGKLVSREQFILPGSSGLYSFGEGDIDADGVTDFLVFDKSLFNTQPDLIMVATTGKTVWRDTKKLGGTPNTFSMYTAAKDMEQKQYIPLRIICADIMPDGRWAVIVGTNFRSGDSLVSKLFDYNQGHVQCLVWDGADLAVNWTSKVYSKYVADYFFDDIDKDGTRELVMLSSQPEGLLGATANRISMYRQARK